MPSSQEDMPPQSWARCTVADITLAVHKIDPKSNPAQEIRYIDISGIDNQANRISATKTFALSGAPSRARQIVRAGDVLFSTVRPYLRNIASVNKELEGEIASTGFAVLRPAEGIVPEFLFHKVTSQEFVDEISGKQYGASYPAVKDSQVRALALSLPPLNEQRRIVEEIETLFARLDQGEAALRQVQSLLTRYRQSVLKAAVTGQLTADWRTENAHRVEHGRDLVTSNWQSFTLGELLNDIRYGTAKKCRPEKHGTAVLRIPNVVSGRIDLDDLKYTELDDKETKKLSLKEGDVLIVRSNGSANLVGRSAVVDQKAEGFAFAGYLIRLRLDQSKLLPHFLHLVLSSPILRSRIEREARSTSGVHNLNSSEIKAISFELPPPNEQKEIVDSVERTLNKINRLELWCQTELTRSATLRQSILKQAFAGRLVAQDPNDEPASELLARIRRDQPAASKCKSHRKATA